MLLVLCGNTAVGKDTYQNLLLDRNPDLHRAVSHTTRPRRRGEKDGREYHFISGGQFMELFSLGGFIETRQYNTIEKGEETVWTYGLSYSEMKNDRDSIVILDHQGTKMVLENSEDVEIKVVYLKSPVSVLKERSLNRKDELEEFERRLADDLIEFKGIEKIADLMLDTDTDDHEENLLQIEALFGGVE